MFVSRAHPIFILLTQRAHIKTRACCSAHLHETRKQRAFCSCVKRSLATFLSQTIARNESFTLNCVDTCWIIGPPLSERVRPNYLHVHGNVSRALSFARSVIVYGGFRKKRSGVTGTTGFSLNTDVPGQSWNLSCLYNLKMYSHFSCPFLPAVRTKEVWFSQMLTYLHLHRTSVTSEAPLLLSSHSPFRTRLLEAPLWNNTRIHLDCHQRGLMKQEIHNISRMRRRCLLS